MNTKKILWPTLLGGLILGTAWAVRGKFGHEQGAAWAGAIGAMGIVLLSKKQSWLNKSLSIILASAFGWGLSGMISYGLIVGYARVNQFLNVYYGLSMLLLIGILYGILGGGMFGLALLDSKKNKVNWLVLISILMGGGLLTYGFFIYQLEWFMTPPRSELWAVCLGASLFLCFYLYKQNYFKVLKIALWSGLGAGFGFAFGNFLQVMGDVSGYAFNFWNVMEYAIGFFGGAGMAFGTFSSVWEEDENEDKSNTPIPEKFISLFLVFFLVPLIVWVESFYHAKVMEYLQRQNLKDPAFMASLIQWGAFLCIIINLIMAIYWAKPNLNQPSFSRRSLFNMFISTLGVYILLSFLVTGLLVHPLEQYLYLINFVVVIVVLPRVGGVFDNRTFSVKFWITSLLVILLFLAIFSYLASSLHEGLPGGNFRFQHLPQIK